MTSLINPSATVQFDGTWSQVKKKVLIVPSAQATADYAEHIRDYVQATTGFTEIVSLFDWQVKAKRNKNGSLKLKMKQKGSVSLDKFKAKMKGVAFES